MYQLPRVEESPLEPAIADVHGNHGGRSRDRLRHLDKLPLEVSVHEQRLGSFLLGWQHWNLLTVVCETDPDVEPLSVQEPLALKNAADGFTDVSVQQITHFTVV